MSTARDDVLGRIRAIDRGHFPPHRREYRRESDMSRVEQVERFCERVADYRAEVRRLPRSAVADAVAGKGLRRVGVPPGLPAGWRPTGVELVEDNGLTPRELDRLDGVVTGCTVAIAETGTIVLAAGPSEGRRALTLIPDLHVCVVDESQIVGVVPEAIARLGALVREERRPLTFVSGPSATSDIELSRVEGVHGPRTLIVLVTSEESP